MANDEVVRPAIALVSTADVQHTFREGSLHTIFEQAFEHPLAAPFTENRRALRSWFYVGLLVSDLLCIFVAFALGALINRGDLGSHGWLRIAFAASPIFVICAVHNGAYSLGALRSAVTGVKRAIAALIAAFAVLFVVSYFLKAGQDMSRLGVGLGLATATILVLVTRNHVGTWIKRKLGDELTSTLVIADESFVPSQPGRVVVDALQLGIRPEPRNPVMVQRFVQLVAKADRVIVSCQREVCSQWAAMLKSANACGEIVADEIQTVGAVALGHFGDKTTLVVSPGPLSWQQRSLKRALDLCLAVPILLFIAPVLVAVAVAIKLDSPGPVLFRQPRVGLGNRLFNIYKFRSMQSAASDTLASTLTARDDVRTTRVGRFIRRTSLDELPQLFNVIEGSMSLVGPRPHAIGALAGPLLYWHVDDRYSHRHLLKPGITGLAQVRGFRGSTSQVNDLSNRLQADLEYIAGWSIWRDLTILLKTFNVLTHPNAY